MRGWGLGKGGMGDGGSRGSGRAPERADRLIGL